MEDICIHNEKSLIVFPHITYYCMSFSLAVTIFIRMRILILFVRLHTMQRIVWNLLSLRGRMSPRASCWAHLLLVICLYISYLWFHELSGHWSKTYGSDTVSLLSDIISTQGKTRTKSASWQKPPWWSPTLVWVDHWGSGFKWKRCSLYSATVYFVCTQWSYYVNPWILM